jgi:hypothetical protein
MGPDHRTWIHVITPGGSTDPALARDVLNSAPAALNRL